jgi:predicted alpha-1,6-mannanase (GH76 family)
MCRNFKKTKSIGMFCHFEGGGEGGLFKGILHDYQMFAEIFYRRYPCVGTSSREPAFVFGIDRCLVYTG